MSDYDTFNPVPSIDPRDLDDNATILDLLLNGLALQYNSRLGVPLRSFAGMRQDALAFTSANVAALAALVGSANTLPIFTGPGAMSLLGIGAANGLATLGADSKIPAGQLPALAISETFTVASQAAMLALTAQQGDVAIRTDQSNKPYILAASDPAILANWVALDQTLSVALAALSGLAPAADRMPYFNSVNTAALATITAFARSLLDDADAATMLATLTAYGRPNILATVSQAGGVPTGGVFETGGNANNGKWTKYADGTMEFSRRLSVTSAISTAAGSMFYSGGIAATPMGITFAGDLPEVQVTLEDAAGISWATLGGPPTLTNFPVLYLLAPSSVASRTYTVNLKAKGRWF